MRVLSVVGNRPQFIKSAPLSVALRGHEIEEVSVHTGQHWDPELSQVFYDELGLPEPAYRLDARSREIGTMQPGIAEAIANESPDLVLVFGDTNSTLAGARAAVEAGVPLAHVEAGLRSGDWSMPEEHARVEVDRLASLLLTPDERAADTLRGEGVPGEIRVVGDVMGDVCFELAPIARERSTILDRLGRRRGEYVAATLHRDANVVQPRLGRILSGLGRLDEPVELAAHPRTRLAIERDAIELAPNVRLLEPLPYLEFSALASQARVIVTDSGGVQKEAYWYRVPCVTARPSTEWVDTVENGANVLVDDDADRLVDAVGGARLPDELPPLYGDGHAADRIAEALYTLSRA
jgi:UDP-N-acetylglucosamine 2-epimerase